MYSFSAPRIEEEDVIREIHALSQEERDHAYRDLYGEDVPIEETPDMLAVAFSELTAALLAIPESETAVFRRAIEVCPIYVSSIEFKLMFLRATRFDVEAAALRIIAYWEEKLKIFGPERTFRKLSLQDMTQDEHEIALCQGGIQVMPGTDSSGRGLLFYDRTRFDPRRSHRVSMHRAHWYILHSIIEHNPVVQKNGIVALVYTSSHSKLESFDRKFIVAMLHHIRSVVPVRMTGLHHVIQSSIIRLIMPIVYYCFGAELRARYRPYTGMTGAEIVEAIKPFGISSETLPIEFGGQFQFDYSTWIETRQRIENNAMEEG